jgi:phage terminase large subunit
MEIETQIRLNKFKLRDYQIPILDAIENKKYKRVLAILPRRAGKDFACWLLMIRMSLKRVGVYWYILPTYAQGRKILWDGITTDGIRFIDFLPKELVLSTNSQLMQFKLTNGSIIQIVGSDNVDSLVGSNPLGCVFSEYALQDPRAYQFLRPVLTANDGWAVFISTPRGKNSLWELWNIAQSNTKDWYSYKMTVLETGHIPLHYIEREKLSGEMSEDLIQQEYYCSFDMGVEGSYYSKYIDRMRLKGQIGMVPWESSCKVNTCFDLGVRDSTCIIFFQVIGQTVRIIDCYDKNKEGLEHYVKVLESKPYVYGKHIFPHDIRVQELGSGITRIEKLKQLGIKVTIADDVSIVDGIEAVRSSFSKIWIDEKQCAPLIKAIENYRQEYDAKRKVYKSNPLHSWASHYSDALRYLCISLPKTRDGLTPEDLDRRYQEAIMGPSAGLPSIFRDDLPNY